MSFEAPAEEKPAGEQPAETTAERILREQREASEEAKARGVAGQAAHGRRLIKDRAEKKAGKTESGNQ
ncbi:MAG: hypothetical protein Q8P49_00405 [Candidatus Liptonbacteria bacterium]|nr:hypothetical protein [Candidatus Liptonbacteria bacterium]